MQVLSCRSEAEWEQFLLSQPWPPFLQSVTMGEVYRRVGQEPVRIEVRKGSTGVPEYRSDGTNDDDIIAICQAIVVPAKRGKHLAVPYGPVLAAVSDKRQAVSLLLEELRKTAREHACSFIRLSPFWRKDESGDLLEELSRLGFRPSPMHLLAEHIWYLDLQGRIAEGLLMGMRATTRNLIRRAAREGVVVQPSSNPVRDFSHFWKLYEETGTRHGFILYPRDLLLSELEMFSERDQARLYLAKLNGEVLAASIHMFYGGITSYHHGASTNTKIPASYLLQWRAIQDAMLRGDRIYNFWGVAPLEGSNAQMCKCVNAHHPFAGVTTFKTGFGGELLELVHCMDLPLTTRYLLTWSVEKLRKVRRGF